MSDAASYPRIVTLDALTEQSRARAARKLSEPLTVSWEGGSLVFPLLGTESPLVREAWQIQKFRAMFTALWDPDKAQTLMTKLTRLECEGIWELVGTEYEFQSSAGLTREEEQYKRWQEVRKGQRERLGYSTEEEEEPEELTLPEDASGKG